MPAAASLSSIPTRFGQAETRPVRRVAMVDFYEPVDHTLAETLSRRFKVDSHQLMPYLDIDGDRIHDLPHGDVLERVMQGVSKDRIEFTRFKLPLVQSDTPWLDYARQVLARCQDVEAAIRQGQRFDAVNLSLAFNAEFKNTVVRTPEGRKVTLHPGNLKIYAPALRQALKEEGDPYLDTVLAIVDTLERIVRHGIPVYIGAGNEGAGRFNLLSLAEGAHVIGATDARGNKTPYTAENDCVDRYVQGTFAVTRVPGGFDLTGSGQAQVKDSEVSGGRSWVIDWQGQPTGTSAASPTDIQAVVAWLAEGNPLSEAPAAKTKVFPVMDLVMQSLQAQMQGLNIEALARLSALGDYIHLPTSRMFKASEGKLCYNPDNSGREQAINQVDGTSLSAPVAIVQDWEKAGQRVNRFA